MSRIAQFQSNLRRFRLVSFDITDTLLRFSRPPTVQYAKTASELGLQNINQDRLAQCFRDEFKSMSTKYPNYGLSTPDMSWQCWWIELVEKIFRCAHPGIAPEKVRIIAETLLRQYRTSACWTHVEGGKELIQKMRDGGKYVGVISNFDPSLRHVLGVMGLEQKFDFILTSYDAGSMKPSPGIFNIPLEQFKVQANEALHIGNIFEIDYMGARNSGWSSLLVTKSIGPSLVGSPHVYTNLIELTNALESKKIDW